MKRTAQKTSMRAPPSRQAEKMQPSRGDMGAPTTSALLRLLGRFVLISCAVYTALLLLWPLLGDSYNRAFIATSHTLFHSIGDNVQVVFTRIEEQGGRDVSMQVRNMRVGMMVERHIPSRYSGYLPAALLIGLIAATPLPWRRKLLGLLVGMIALHIYIFTVLLLTIIRVLSRDGPAQLYELSQFWDGLLEHVIHHTTTSPTFSMLVPAVLWAVVMFRRGDLAMLLSQSSGNRAQ